MLGDGDKRRKISEGTYWAIKETNPGLHPNPGRCTDNDQFDHSIFGVWFVNTHRDA